MYKMKKQYICKFKIREKISEEIIELNEESPEKIYKEIIKGFNKEEKRRYGNNTELREFVSVKLKEEQVIYCDFKKKYMGLRDGRKVYDLLVCSRCKKRCRRYGFESPPKTICKGENYYGKSYKD